MKKIDEILRKDSCLNKARPNEFIFVLLERDLAATHAVLEWVSKRIELCLNNPQDKQILEALDWIEHCAKLNLDPYNDPDELRHLLNGVESIRKQATSEVLDNFARDNT